jgi:hypothetical protein
MAANRVLGYGGLANTFGLRDFSGKEAAVAVPSIEAAYVGSGLGSGIGFRKRKRELLWWAFSYFNLTGWSKKLCQFNVR